MWLTASGGPFRTWTAEQIAAATPEQALKHPNWAMGPKVTVDSASLMNKGLELIEAMHIFAIPAEKLDVLVHPAKHRPWPRVLRRRRGDRRHGRARHEGAYRPLPGFSRARGHAGAPARSRRAGDLDLREPDFDRFPALRVAMDALRAGGALPTILNAANEIMVAAFLNKQIGFNEIASEVEAVCEDFSRRNATNAPGDVEEALAIDHIVRERSLTRVRGLGR